MHAENPTGIAGVPAEQRSIYPIAFRGSEGSSNADAYLKDPATRTLLEFFELKGLQTLKAEDQREEWYDDWIAYQGKHSLYASVLSPEAYSTHGAFFDLLRYARFLESFAYCSPAHGYSLQVTFLGLFSLLMGTNAELKKEAVAALEAGNVMAFGVSEKDHGSDLMANEFTVTKSDA